MTDKDADGTEFLRWALPRLGMRWAGFRRVRGQVCKRLGWRIAELGPAELEEYRALLETHLAEWTRLDCLCRISISRFYLDQGVRRTLEREIEPRLADRWYPAVSWCSGFTNRCRSPYDAVHRTPLALLSAYRIGERAMLGAIAGDIVGSAYEAEPVKTTDFELFPPGAHFTDDTVLTLATAETLLGDGDYAGVYRRYGRAFPDAGYGGNFFRWLFRAGAGPYNSWGNGAAMRVSPVGFALHTVEDILAEAARSAAVTHNHSEGIKGAQATALAIFLARSGETKAKIRSEIQRRFGYDLERSIDAIRSDYGFDVSCQGSVPESLIAFLGSTDYESAVRNAVSLGGDADTMACIAGGIAQAFYGAVPKRIASEVRARLPEDLLNVLDRFERRYGLASGNPTGE